MPNHDPFLQTWLRLLAFLLSLAQGVAVLVVGVLLYAWFGQVLADWWAPAPQVAAKPYTPPALRQLRADDGPVQDGIHLATGLVVAEHWELVRTTCTACHSAQLLTQTRATRDGWAQKIRWMQETQGLWPLGPMEPKILDYLAAHYAPEATGRRPNLTDVEFYILEL